MDNPVFEPYTDSFVVCCGFPIGMKRGDGSDIPCLAPASYRLIFWNGGRDMVCARHKRRLERIWNAQAMRREPASGGGAQP